MPIMGPISFVARGRTSGSSTFARCMTSMNFFENSSATSAAVRPCSFARLMILSSTSVRFCANVTS